MTLVLHQSQDEMHVKIRLGNKVNVRVVGNPEIQLGFLFFLCRCSDEARYFSPCMALLLNVVTHK